MNASAPRLLPAAEAGDVVLWTGRPAFRATALRVLKVGWVAAWFTMLLLDGARLAMGAHPPPHAWAGEGSLAAVSLAVLAGLLGLAAWTSRSTRYTVGVRAVTLRYGLALRATLVIPFAAIERVEVRTHRDGAGDVALRLKPGPSAPYAKLWPHARPWRLRRAEPMLRGVPDAGVAAALVCRALAARDVGVAPTPGSPQPVTVGSAVAGVPTSATSGV